MKKVRRQQFLALLGASKHSASRYHRRSSSVPKRSSNETTVSFWRGAAARRSLTLRRCGSAETVATYRGYCKTFTRSSKLRVKRLNDVVAAMEPAPRNLAANLWVIDRPFKLPFVRAEIGTRMTCIRLADGCLLLHSPVKLDAALRRWLNALGEIRAIVAPNKLHHLYLTEYVTSYPNARIYAAPGLSKKRSDIVSTAS